MFELEKILVQESSDIPSFTLQKSVRESSFVNMTLSAISEYKADFRKEIKNFYVVLSESNGDRQAITEGFSDFFNKVVELIKKFLKFIQKLFDKFISHINGLVKSEKYLKKHKDALKKFTSENEFDYQNGYEFTFDSSIPLVSSDVISLNPGKFNFNTFASNFTSSQEEISKKLLEYKEAIVHYIEEDFENVFRGIIIGSDTPIAAEDFDQELFAVFRNGDTDSTTITVTRSVVDACYRSFDNYDEFLKAVRKQKERIEKEYKIKEKEVTSFSKTVSKNDYLKFINTYIDPTANDTTAYTLTDADVANIVLIMKAKSDQITRSMDIHAIAFAAKMDAIKAQYKQDKDILYKVLYKIGIRESGIVDIEDIDDEDIFSSETEPETDPILDSIVDIEIGESGMWITTKENREVFIEGEYSLSDIANPTEELIDTFIEKGILDIDDAEDAYSSEIFLTDPEVSLKVGSEELPNPENISYDIFLASEACNDAVLFAELKTLILSESGQLTTESYQIIQEGLADTIKNGWTKLINAIVTVWNKFVQTMEELFKNDKKYLEKYSEIIKKRAVKIESIDCNSYFDEGHGVKKAISNEFNDVIKLNSAEIESKEKDWLEQRKAFLRSIGHDGKLEDKEAFQDAILDHLKGPETSYDTKQIQANMTNMYDFCYNFKNYKDSSKKLLSELEKFVADYEKRIESLSKSAESEKKETEQTTESFYYFTEDNVTINNPKGGEDGASSSSTTTSSSSVSANSYKADPSKDSNDEKRFEKSSDAIDKDNSKEKLEIMKNNVQEALKFGSSILLAKISFGETCYKDYMKIIRAHVRFYAKSPEKDKDENKTTAPENTDVKKVEAK